MNVDFFELTPAIVAQRTAAAVVEDINRLLPQLSTSGAQVSAEWLNQMFEAGTQIFVATDGEHIVGTVLRVPMMIFTGQKDWIEDVVVDESHRDRGIADRLMEMAEAAMVAHGSKSSSLTSNSAREAAHRLYKRRGYIIHETTLFRKPF